VADRLRPGGWLVFDLHTDAMMDLTISNGVVAGRAAENDFVISSAVDPMNAIQVELLRRWRATGDEEVKRPLLRSIAGIAAALRNTG